jgi:sucrose-6-phosphate hydrolase SacC (GH32 family)
MATFVRLALILELCVLQIATAQTYTELYRPQYHFTPAQNWMNDPSGLLYYNGVYHMYYQYNPSGTTWGDISWGHATSIDLTHWQQQPIALLARGFPGEITEMFFTGSVVVDIQNTSGFGVNGTVPFVAMYTSYVGTETLLHLARAKLSVCPYSIHNHRVCRAGGRSKVASKHNLLLIVWMMA